MPQDGSNNYQYPPGTPGIPDQTIESEAYNTFLDDLVVNDLNIPRPIHRGGTNATTADQALINLHAEKSSQVVTNYDSHVFMNGSFQSSPGATGAPEPAGFYTGVVHLGDFGGLTGHLEARETGSGLPGKRYARAKNSAGVWGPWVLQAGGSDELDARYVNVTGDTMTGILNIVPTGTAILTMQKTASGDFNAIRGLTGTSQRWQIQLGDTTAETGSETGSHFSIDRFSDTGTYWTSPLIIARDTGNVFLKHSAVVGAPPGLPPAAGELYAGALSTSSTVSFNLIGGKAVNAGYTSWLNYSPANGYMTFYGSPSIAAGATPTMTARVQFSPVGDITGQGALNVAQQAVIGTSLTVANSQASPPLVIYTNAGAHYLTFGNAYINYAPASNSTWSIYSSTGLVSNFRGADTAFFHYGQAYKPGGGAWQDSSDARIKNVLGDFTAGLDQVLALNPIKYTFKGNDTQDPPALHQAPNAPGQEVKQPRSDPVVVPYENSPHYNAAKAGIEFIGLIAQDVEAAIPQMVTQTNAYIDGVAVTDLRNIDTGPLVFALVNAVKELAARVEQLEAAG